MRPYKRSLTAIDTSDVRMCVVQVLHIPLTPRGDGKDPSIFLFSPILETLRDFTNPLYPGSLLLFRQVAMQYVIGSACV